MTKKNHHHVFWDLYSEKMRSLILEHKRAKKNEGTKFFDERLSLSYQIDLIYDEEREMITEFNYSISGPTFMIAFMEGLADIVINSRASKLGFIKADDVFEKISVYEIATCYNDADISDYVQFLSPYINHLIDSYLTVVEQLVPKKFTTPEALTNFSIEGKGIDGFMDFSKEQKLGCIEDVMEKDIRPYVALDDGGVKVKDITKNGVVLIQYEGNCTSCHAAGSTTLSAITSILQAKVHPNLEVLPFIS